MKLIDILNKIANGEEVPKVIKSEGHYYNYNELERDYYEGNGYDYEYLLKNISVNNLNDEVEIIEEDKKIEKIRELKTFPSIDDEEYAYEDGRRDKNVLIHNQIEKLFIDKINEIIDYLNKENK